MHTDGRRSFGKEAGRTRGFRWPAATVSSFLVLVQALTAFHLALVRHSICPEHGEPIHVRSGIVAIPQEAPEPSSEDVARRPSVPLLAQGPHEHCMLLIQRRDLLSEAASFTAATCHGPDGPDAALDNQHPLRRSELLMLAPKHSPPA